MKSRTETQKKIIEVGRREFLEKGFKDASLNKIVAEAGFTKGAFYGYYKDKAALFEDIVSEAADGLVEQFKSAQDEHFDLIPKGKTHESRTLSTEYLHIFASYIYDHPMEFKLVLKCSEGTRYANWLEELVNLQVSRTEEYYKLLRKKGKIKGTVSRSLHKMVTRAYFTAVFEPILHDMKKKEAMKYIEDLATFFNAGWDSLIEIQ